jgi:cytochrome c5
VNKRLAKWIVVKAGNLAVRLAPQAGFDLVFRLRSHKRNQVPAAALAPELFRATCDDCNADSFEFEGSEGATVLQYFCVVCQGRQWKVTPVVEHQPHQGSRRQS